MPTVGPAEKKTEFTANLETAAWDTMKYLDHLLSGLGQLLWKLSEVNARHKLMFNQGCTGGTQNAAELLLKSFWRARAPTF